MFNKAKILLLVWLVSFPIAAQAQEKAQGSLAASFRQSVVAVISYSKDGSMLRRGAGFFISEEGDIMTLASLLPSDADHTEVITSDGKAYRISRIVGTDKRSGLIRAALDTPLEHARPLPSRTFGPQVGDRVRVISDAAEQEIRGIITDVDALDADADFRVAATLPDHSSGSPIFNDRGEVIGVVEATTAGGQNFTAKGLGRAVFLYPQGAAFQHTGGITEESNPGLMRRGESFLQGTAVTRVAPSYPPVAKRLRVDGTIIVQVIVDEKGEVTSAKPLKVDLRCHLEGQTEVPAEGADALKQAAVDAIRQWKFVPSRLEGKPIKVIGTITVNFHL
jgi:hypothetical protein